MMLVPRFKKVFQTSLLSYQNNLSNTRNIILRNPSTLFLFMRIPPVRNYASKMEELRELQETLERFDPKYIPEADFGIIDPYLKPSQMPSIFSREYYRILYKNARNSFRNFVFAMNIAYYERKSSEYKENSAEYWSPTPFKSKALDIYVKMNENFASKNLKALQSLVEDQMYNKMKFELKNREGKFTWQYHGLVEKPKYTNIRCILGQARSTGNYLAQVTLKLHTKQSVGLYNKTGKLIAGDPKKIKNVLQYVVFQRKMWEKNKGWAIYGYMQQE